MQLYILKFKEVEIIKIGISTSPVDRIFSLGASNKIDWDNSYLVTSSNKRNIRRLETQLHGDFEAFRMDESNEYLNSGNTEIFKSECLANVLKEIEHKVEFHPHLQLAIKKGIEKPVPVRIGTNNNTQKQDILMRNGGRLGIHFFGLRELISLMIKYRNDSEVTCFDYNKPYGDFHVMLISKELKPENTPLCFVGIYNPRRYFSGSRYTSSIISGEDFACFQMSGHFSNENGLPYLRSNGNERKHFFNLKKFILKKARKIGLNINTSCDVSWQSSLHPGSWPG